ncbi:MAG: cation diffusion facilitator family transporter [Pseudomonadota bacterium]
MHSADETANGGARPESRQNPSAGYKTEMRAMCTALAAGLAIMVLKFYAFRLTNSSAILSDALESIINVVASGFALVSLWISARPPDTSHPYGHGKIEYFSAGFEGALIILAAVGIFAEGVRQILTPRGLPHLQSGLSILLGAGLVNLVLAAALIRIGKRTGSIVLEADGKHIMTDVFSSGGVLVGLVLVQLTGWYRLDGIVACLVGIQIVVSGFQLVRTAFGGLMDASDPALLEEICALLSSSRRDLWIDVHRLRAKRSGKRVQVDFHLILPRDIALEAAHKEVKDLEDILSDYLGGQADVLIHLDPCNDPDCPVCAKDRCDLRQSDLISQRIWNREVLTCETESHPRLGDWNGTAEVRPRH